MQWISNRTPKPGYHKGNVQAWGGFQNRSTITTAKIEVTRIVKAERVRSPVKLYTDTVPSVKSDKQAAGMILVLNVLPIKCGCFSISDS